MVRIGIFCLFISGFIIALANAGGRATVSDAGNTGAPCEDGLVCGNCHLGGPYGPVNQTFRLIDPLTDQEQTTYAPGKRYNVEITVVPSLNASRYGFQATVLDTANTDAGTWMNPANSVQIATATVFCGPPSTRTYIEHVLPNFTRTFRIDWEAPGCDIGDITFYYISNAVNNDSSTSGDVASNPGSTTISFDRPEQITIDSSSIPGGNYIAGGQILVAGSVMDSNIVLLAAPDSIRVMDTLTIVQGSELTVLNADCL